MDEEEELVESDLGESCGHGRIAEEHWARSTFTGYTVKRARRAGDMRTRKWRWWWDKGGGVAATGIELPVTIALGKIFIAIQSEGQQVWRKTGSRSVPY